MSLKKALFTGVLLLYFLPVHAGVPPVNMSLRTGMVNGSYSNPLENTVNASEESSLSDNLESGGFSVLPSFDFELELFSSPTTSYYGRTIVAMNMSTGVMNYNYFGFGTHRYYKGFGYSKDSTGDLGFAKLMSKSRQYYGVDVGLSRVSVVQFGPVLSAESTGIDLGVHWGYTKQMGRAWAINAQVGLSYAYGVSNVAVAGMNMYLLFGTTLGM